MKKLLYSITLFFCFCTATKKVEYEFPEAMRPEVKKAYIEICDRGQAIYKATCAKCHNYKVKGKWVVPDFTQEQLVGYSLRIINQRHETNLPDSLISEEELGQVMTFLEYKKKNK